MSIESSSLEFLILEKARESSDFIHTLEEDDDAIDTELLSSLKYGEKLFHVVKIFTYNSTGYYILPNHMLENNADFNPVLFEKILYSDLKEFHFLFAINRNESIIFGETLSSFQLIEEQLLIYEEQLYIKQIDFSGNTLQKSQMPIIQPKSSIQNIDGYEKGFNSCHDYEEEERKLAVSSRYVFLPSSHNSHIYVYDITTHAIIPVDLYAETGHINSFEIFEIEKESLLFSVVHLENFLYPINRKRSKFRLTVNHHSYEIKLLELFKGEPV